MCTKHNYNREINIEREIGNALNKVYKAIEKDLEKSFKEK